MLSLPAAALIRGTIPLAALSGCIVIAGLRDVKWIRNLSRAKLQKKFKHADVFGIKGNSNNNTLEAYRKALENHVRSPDTKVIKGTYHKEKVTHYYNPKTRINVMRDKNGEFKSTWKLGEKQRFHMMKDGSLGGN